MGIFATKTGPELRDNRVDAILARMEVLTDRLDALALAQADLERPVRELELEWLDAFEKFRNLYARITKRIEREGASDPATDTVATGQPTVTNPLALKLMQQGGE